MKLSVNQYSVKSVILCSYIHNSTIALNKILNETPKYHHRGKVIIDLVIGGFDSYLERCLHGVCTLYVWKGEGRLKSKNIPQITVVQLYGSSFERHFPMCMNLFYAIHCVDFVALYTFFKLVGAFFLGVAGKMAFSMTS